jgi:uncharacterized phage protein (TIGR01671 family)
MREILFRGRKENGVWTFGYLFVQAEGTEYEDAHILGYLDHRDSVYEIWKCAEPVDPETIGQYTGMKDKNGTRIFEGDILNYPNSINYVVQWNNSQAKYCVRGINDEDYDELYNLIESYTEIIGNIYDNPELLEECV